MLGYTEYANHLQCVGG